MGWEPMLPVVVLTLLTDFGAPGGKPADGALGVVEAVKADAGCGRALEENDFSVVTANETISAMCCGP